jgi:hypothetical protein
MIFAQEAFGSRKKNWKKLAESFIVGRCFF